MSILNFAGESRGRTERACVTIPGKALGGAHQARKPDAKGNIVNNVQDISYFVFSCRSAVYSCGMGARKRRGWSLKYIGSMVLFGI